MVQPSLDPKLVVDRSLLMVPLPKFMEEEILLVKVETHPME
jgi:hypothetical protein